MITTAEEYLQQLWSLYDEHIPTKAILLPSDETMYEIDLNTRVIKTPSFLSVKKDQAAETIYFLIDRFAGQVDLATTACIVQYKNATGQSFYPVPFYDITTYSSHITNNYLEVDLNSGTYEKGKYYIKVENEYIISNKDYDDAEVYYAKNDPSTNKKYVYANNVTEETYQPNLYYYFVNDYSSIELDASTYEPDKYYIKSDDNYILATSGTYNANETYYVKEVSGSYVLDSSVSFNPRRNYYVSIDKRYVKAHVEYSNYKIETYYILNQNNEMVLSMGQFNPENDYYTLVDKPKILFPWQIGNIATEEAGILEFSIRFYQVDTPTGRLVYNLNTLPAKSKILDTMEVEIKDDEFEDIKDDLVSSEYNEILGRQATVLEDLYYKIAMKDTAIYWDEA